MPVIATNTAANTALKYLNWNSDEQSANLARIASGSRITKASDDAAGLAIGTRMQTDVKTLAQASTNAEHGESVLSTADGGLSSINDILQRMKTLATQSVSGTVSTTELAYIQAELDELSEEISDIATATTFNGTSLLDGTSNYTQTASVGTVTDASSTGAAATADPTDATFDDNAKNYSYTITTGTAATDVASVTLSKDSGTATTLSATAYTESSVDSTLTLATGAADLTDGTYTISVTGTNASGTTVVTALSITDADGNTTALGTTAGDDAYYEIDGDDVIVHIGGAEVTYDGTANLIATSSTDSASFTVAKSTDGYTVDNTGDITIDSGGITLTADASAIGAATAGTVSFDVTVSGGVEFMCGTSAEDILTVTVGDASADALGVETLDVTTSSATRTAAIEAIDSAIDSVSAMRADVGAQMSRFGYRADMLDTSSENIDAAASAILDADIAEEQTDLAANEVKTQAAIAALAQANSLPSQLLDLLQ